MADAQRSRVTVSRQAGRLAVSWRRDRHLGAALVLTAWLGGWAFGEVMVLRALLDRLFDAGPAEPGSAVGLVVMVAWLAVWTAGGAMALLHLARSLGGGGEVEVEGGTLSLRGGAWPLSPRRRYPLSEVRAVRRVARAGTARGRLGRRLGWAPPPLAFDRAGRVVGFGAGLEDHEADQVLEALRGRVPLEETPPNAAAASPSAVGRKA